LEAGYTKSVLWFSLVQGKRWDIALNRAMALKQRNGMTSNGIMSTPSHADIRKVNQKFLVEANMDKSTFFSFQGLCILAYSDSD
jgi:hypothetical protein